MLVDCPIERLLSLRIILRNEPWVSVRLIERLHHRPTLFRVNCPLPLGGVCKRLGSFRDIVDLRFHRNIGVSALLKE